MFTKNYCQRELYFSQSVKLFMRKFHTLLSLPPVLYCLYCEILFDSQGKTSGVSSVSDVNSLCLISLQNLPSVISHSSSIHDPGEKPRNPSPLYTPVPPGGSQGILRPEKTYNLSSIFSDFSGIYLENLQRMTFRNHLN